MKYGIITDIQEDGVLVDIGEDRQKPMRIPKGIEVSVGDGACVKKINGTYIVVNVYEGKVPLVRTTLADMPVGSEVILNVGGVPTEFLIVQQGSPSSGYVGFENGTVLLMKSVYGNTQIWGAYYSSYNNSPIHSYVNNTFLPLLDSDIQTAVLTVRIPYRPNIPAASISSGSSGLSCRAFILSGGEIGIPPNTTNNQALIAEGTLFSYFLYDDSSGGQGRALRICYRSGVAVEWWSRSSSIPQGASLQTVTVYATHAVGTFSEYRPESNYKYIRPAFVLPNSLYVVDGVVKSA